MCTSTGNVILLFDGFDEIASNYKYQFTQLIKSLLGTSIEKIFVKQADQSRPNFREQRLLTNQTFIVAI
jgi:hypothetical protein